MAFIQTTAADWIRAHEMEPNMSNRASRPWLFVLALLAPSCGTDDYHPPTETLSGVVEIGYAIQNATVFVDFNDDNLLDSNEPQVSTDATGHFTLTWDNPGPLYARSVVAVVVPSSTRVGVVGANAAVGFGIHLRAPLAGPAVEASAVITPLSTLVASEMASDSTLSEAGAAAKVAGALSASQLPFSGQPLDVMADYVAGAPTSTDSAQLRHAAGAVAATLATAVAEVNAAQSFVDCNRATYFNPIAVAADQQLTAIASGTFRFAQLTGVEQADLEHNPGNYTGYFIDTAALAAAIKAELEAEAIALASELFDSLAEEFVQRFEEDVIRLVAGELIAEIIGG